MSPLLLPALLLLQAPPGASAHVSLGASADTVTVGDRFEAYVRLQAAPGTRVRFAAVGTRDPVQQVGATRVAAAPGEASARYPLVAWIAGARPDVAVAVATVGPAGDTARYLVPLRLPFVRSVLPADTAGLRPKPARGLVALPRPREWYRLVVLGLALLAALGAVAWLWRRRPARPVAPEAPRDVALRELDALRGAPLRALAEGRGGPADYGAFYTAAVWVARSYLARLDARWGEQLAASELVARLSAAGVPPDRVAALAGILAAAEPVRFAGVTPTAGGADRLAAELRAWIAGFPEPGESRSEAA